MSGESKELKINLKCPVGISTEDYYLDLIDFLMNELSRNNIDVKVFNENILQERRLHKKIEQYENMIQSCNQKLDQLATSNKDTIIL